jgi:hypothetical protein
MQWRWRRRSIPQLWPILSVKFVFPTNRRPGLLIIPALTGPPIGGAIVPTVFALPVG